MTGLKVSAQLLIYPRSSKTWPIGGFEALKIGSREEGRIHSRVETAKKDLDSPSKIVRLFRQRLSDFSFLMRGASALFSWGKILPLSKELQSLNTTLSAHISATRALFAAPRLIFNSLDLYNAGVDFIKSVKSGGAVDCFSVLNKVKSVFVSTIKFSSSVLSTIFLLNGHSIINLKKISEGLYKGLLYSHSSLFLAMSSISWMESIWALGGQIKMDLSTIPSEGLSPKLTRSVVRACGSTLSLIVSALRAAIVFAGISLGPLSPLILTALSSLSFLTDLVGRMLTQEHLVYEDDASLLLQDPSHLRA